VLQIYPNPSDGITNIELKGLSGVTFEVLNVLGNVVARHSGAADVWQWNSASQATGLADGTYYVRAVGRDASGREVVLTRSLIVNRRAH
jgi:hypothetical protein